MWKIDGISINFNPTLLFCHTIKSDWTEVPLDVSISTDFSLVLVKLLNYVKQGLLYYLKIYQFQVMFCNQLSFT